MATTSTVTFSSQETKVVFSGVGTVAFEVLSTGPYYLGGAGVDETNGLLIPNTDGPHIFYVTSPDDLYVHCDNSSGSLRVYQNR